MTIITAKLLKRLVWETGAGMMDCKKALDETNGDLGQSIKWLSERGIGKINL